MKKFIIFLIKWTALLLYLILVLSFVKHKRLATVCSKINIEIIGTSKFIDTLDVEKMLTTNGIHPDSLVLNSVNFDGLEKFIELNQAVEDVEVYTDSYGILNIIITQRVPVLRVLTAEGDGFYIDTNGEFMPLSEKYTAHVPILSGDISKEFVASLTTDSLTKELTSQSYSYTLADVYEMLMYMRSHELWNAQIQQIYIARNKDVEIVPVVGNHIIVLGSVTDYKRKLWKMEAMYREGFKLADWNAYHKISLKYSNQVICSK